MKKLSFLLFALCVFLPATAFADIAPIPTLCESRCVPDYYNCETRNIINNASFFESCYGCREAQLESMCAKYLSELEAQKAQEEATLEAERQAQEAAAAQQTKPLETKRSCSALPYAPSQAPLALLIFCLIALGLAIPARRQK